MGPQAAQLHDAAVGGAHDAGEPLQHDDGDRRILADRMAENIRRHDGEQRLGGRHHRGAARPAVDGRELAEEIARREIGEGDLPARGGIVDDPDRA